MAKIVFIGAGSTVFAKNLLGDILSFAELAVSDICLYDIDPERLATTEKVARRIAQVLEANPNIQTSNNRKRALDGADYVITMIQVGGYEPCTKIDFEVPKKYGIQQTIGDTLGIGGIMRALRTIPVMLDICADIGELCPNAWLINYVNPMAMICWAISQARPKIKTIGLCHSVQGTITQIAADIGINPEDIEYECAGINHMAFYLSLRDKTTQEDLYPRLWQVIEEGRVPQWNQVRYKVFQCFGYFPTESSEHFAEYVPWFIKPNRPDLIEQFHIPLGEYPRRCEAQIAGWEKLRQQLEDSSQPLEVKRSNEYGSLIIHGLETGTPYTIYGNVLNNELIANLPLNCCVEVPCFVDAYGIHPQSIGYLPIQLAALLQTNINVQALTVKAALTHKREYIYQAAMLDPLTATALSPDEITRLVDELIKAHSGWLPEYR